MRPGGRLRGVAAATCLIVLLVAATGFTKGPRLDEQEVAQKASFVPALEEYYGKPTVETVATYDPSSDNWLVALAEQTSGETVARFVIADDSGKVSGMKVSPEADEIEYPVLSEEDATRLALADERVQEELSEHGSYSTAADYADGDWTVHFYVEEGGAVRRPD